MSLVQIGDMVRDRHGVDLALIIGHHERNGQPVAWKARFTPIDPELGEPFVHWYPYDFAERDAAAGGLYPADPWSTWTEGR